MRKFFALMIVLAVSATACNKADSKSPLSPSTTTSASPSGGGSGSASIAGTVVGGTSGASVQPMGSGLEVTIVGTSMSATVGSSGRFAFQNVPSGDVALQFTGSGVNARIMIRSVADREQIRLTINVNGNSATLDDNERETPDNRAKVEGRIVSVNCAANPATLVVGRTSQITVLVPAGTPIRHDGTAVACSQLLVGALVEVRGAKNGTSVTASEIELEDNPGPNQGPNPPGVSLVKLEGAISSAITGACPAISFTVGSTSVTTNASTKFDDITCTSLKRGDQVEVEGTSQANGSVLATKVEKEDEAEDEDEDENEAEVRGAISSAVTGTCPSIGFSIGSTNVSTNASTRFDDTSCSALKRGDTVEAKGTRQTNGSILASRVKMRK